MDADTKLRIHALLERLETAEAALAGERARLEADLRQLAQERTALAAAAAEHRAALDAAAAKHAEAVESTANSAVSASSEARDKASTALTAARHAEATAQGTADKTATAVDSLRASLAQTESLASSLSHRLSSFSSETSSTLTALDGQGKELVAADGRLRTSIDGVAAALDTTKKALAEAEAVLKGKADASDVRALSEALASAHGELTAAQQALDHKLHADVAAVQTALLQTLNTIEDGLQDRLAALNGALSVDIDVLSASLAQADAKATAAIDSTATTAAAQLAEARTHLQGAIDSTATTAAAQLAEARTHLQGAIDSTATTAATQLAEARTKLESAVDSLRSSSEESLGSSIARVTELVSGLHSNMSALVQDLAVEVRGRLGSLGSDLADVRASGAEQVAGLERTFNGLLTEVKETHGAQLREAVAGMTSDLSRLNSSLLIRMYNVNQTLVRAVESMEALATAGLAEGLAVLNGTLAREVSVLNASLLSSIQAVAAVVEGQVEGLSDTLSGLAETVRLAKALQAEQHGYQEERLNSTASSLSSLSTRVANLTGRADALARALEDAAGAREADMVAITALLDTLNTSLQARISAVASTAMEGLQTVLEAARADSAAVDRRVSSLATTVQDLNTTVAGALAGLDGRLTPVEETLAKASDRLELGQETSSSSSRSLALPQGARAAVRHVWADGSHTDGILAGLGLDTGLLSGGRVTYGEQTLASLEAVLALAAADGGVAMPDYALATAGGCVVDGPGLTSSTWTAHGVAAATGNASSHARGPYTALDRDTSVGRCWPMAGTSGSLAVRLATPVVLSAVTIDHHPSELTMGRALSSDPSPATSSPRSFTVYGLASPDAAGLAGRVHLGSFSYDAQGPATQVFHLPQAAASGAASEAGRVFAGVQLVVHDNHGNSEFTCLYRFRVHGQPVAA